MRRGKLEMFLALLFGYNGITKRTRVVNVFCGISPTQAKKINLFLVQNDFIERVNLRGTKYTYKRTEMGEKVAESLINCNMRHLMDDSLLGIYERSEKERKLLEFKVSHRRETSVRRSIIIQKMSVLDLLKHGARYPRSRIVSYCFVTDVSFDRVMEELEKDGLVVLYPNKRKNSVGDYGITGAGRAFILRGGEFVG